VQTFLAHPSYVESAKCLDMKRLGKQRVETLQILQTLTYGSQWRNHPAVKMWRGQIPALIEYGIAICEEWLSRGYKDTCLAKIKAFGNFNNDKPSWLGNEDFHKAHRQILLAKNYGWYSQFNWAEQPAVATDGKWPYIWP
jgi:hypothetical protein